jgi:hypothetical protein
VPRSGGGGLPGQERLRDDHQRVGQPAIWNGDLALTSTRLPGGGATVEVARRQPDGSWRWVIDQPAVLP